MATVTYTNGNGNRDWTVAANFSGTGSAPQTGDIVVFDGTEGSNLLPNTNLPSSGTFSLTFNSFYTDPSLSDFAGDNGYTLLNVTSSNAESSTGLVVDMDVTGTLTCSALITLNGQAVTGSIVATANVRFTDDTTVTGSITETGNSIYGAVASKTLTVTGGITLGTGGTINGGGSEASCVIDAVVTCTGAATIDWANSLKIQGGLNANSQTVTHSNASSGTLDVDQASTLEFGNAATGLTLEIDAAVTVGDHNSIGTGTFTHTSGAITGRYSIPCQTYSYVAGTWECVIVAAGSSIIYPSDMNLSSNHHDPPQDITGTRRRQFKTFNAAGVLTTPDATPVVTAVLNGTAHVNQPTVSALSTGQYEYTYTFSGLSEDDEMEEVIVAEVDGVVQVATIRYRLHATLSVDWVNGGRLDLLLDAVKAVTDVIPDAGAMTTIGTDTARLTAARAGALTDWINAGRLDTILDAINAKTTNLPGSPAAVGSAMTLADSAITEAKVTTGYLGAFITVNTGEGTAATNSVAKVAQGAAGGNVTVGDITDAALAKFISEDTGETAVGSGSVAELSQATAVKLLQSHAGRGK